MQSNITVDVNKKANKNFVNKKKINTVARNTWLDSIVASLKMHY